AREWEAADAHRRDLQQQLNTCEAQRTSTTDALAATDAQQAAVEEELTALLVEKDFADLNEVVAVLRAPLDVEAERSRLREYQQARDAARITVEELRRQADGQCYDADDHTRVTTEATTCREKLDQLRDERSRALRAVEDLTRRMQNAKAARLTLDVQQERCENLNELISLFRGSGFVDYVSSIYLHNLCEAANERFLRLTRNQFSLELNEGNEFVVRDHLNDGRTRLLKTLSGGQTFQAALCLALALAENVKSLNQSEQSFFFLDEGFGALDRESLRLVFDTLKALQKENRIVGVISHVEELQQEIGVYLRVENDQERGSQVYCSWE
ncbi:MAG: SbcC/MukB-like Walker B domain-containing protein, partial [Catalinimonas sp.]